MKGNGLKRIFLRNGKKVEMDFCLYAIVKTLFEISTIISKASYKELENTIELQKRWIDIEFIKSAFNGIIKYGRDAIDAMIKAIENPYKSMVKILKSLGLFTSNSSDKINAKL